MSELLIHYNYFHFECAFTACIQYKYCTVLYYTVRVLCIAHTVLVNSQHSAQANEIEPSPLVAERSSRSSVSSNNNNIACLLFLCFNSTHSVGHSVGLALNCRQLTYNDLHCPTHTSPLIVANCTVKKYLYIAHRPTKT